MKNLTPKEARQQLTTLTANIFKLSIEDLSYYFEYAPYDNDYRVAGIDKDKLRAVRNSLQPTDRWHPMSSDYLDKPGDCEDVKFKKDFFFMRDYLRGPNKYEIGGALADCVLIDTASRSPIFASRAYDMWYYQIVSFICANSYGIEIKGDQLDNMGYLFNIITNPKLTDEKAIKKFKQRLDWHLLNKSWDTEDPVRHFLRIVADIISCIIFPIALVRAADSKYNRGTWNFFKPLSSALPRLSDEIFARLEKTVIDNTVPELQRPLIDESKKSEEDYQPVSRLRIPSM